MGARIPKQYLPLSGRPLIAHAIEAVLADPRVVMLVVVVQTATPHWDTVAAALPPAHAARVVAAAGGETRAASVQQGLQALHQRGGLPNDWVLVHDAARPCLRHSDLARLIDAVSSQANADTPSAGGLLGYPVADTLKRVAADGRVLASVPRDGLWRALTPQMFHLGALHQALSRALREGQPCTDETQAMEHVGACPLVVRGNSDNIKITTPADLELAAAILKRRLEEASDAG